MGRLAKCYEYGEEVARSKQSAAPPMTSLTVLLGNGEGACAGVAKARCRLILVRGFYAFMFSKYSSSFMNVNLTSAANH